MKTYYAVLLCVVLNISCASCALRSAALPQSLHRSLTPQVTSQLLQKHSLQVVRAGKEKTSDALFWNVPNVMSVGRLLSVPPFIAAMALRKSHFALALFVVSALTDWMDGYLARMFKVTSKFGAFIDPIADKLLVTSALIMLMPYYPTMEFAIPVAVIICREIFVSGLREWMAEAGKRNAVKVSNWGKLKTVFQMVSTAMLMYSTAPLADLDNIIASTKFLMIGMNLFFASAVLSVLSAAEYAVAALRASA